MAEPAERDRSARARGDIVRGRLAPLVGALAGASVGLELSLDGSARRVVDFAKEALSGRGDPRTALHASFGLVVAGVLPVLAAALVGALLLGMLETRGYLGSLAPTQQRELSTPGVPLGFIGWCLLAVIALQGARLVLGLGVGGASEAVATAAAEVARRLARAMIVAIAAVALVDHLLRARARAARLGEDRPQGRPRAAPLVIDDRAEALLADAELVVFDAELALVIGVRNDEHVLLARARGLAARALEEAARRRRVRVRAVTELASLDALTPGTSLPLDRLAAWGVAAERSP